MVENEHVQILMDLGLTFLQAKVYLALSKTEQARIKVISKTASIARQDAYRVMPTLEKLGLAEKLLTTPATYKGSSLKEGYYLLLQNKAREHLELQKKTTALIKNLREEKDNTTPQEEEPQFVITSSKELLFRRFAEREKIVQTSIDIIGVWKDLRRTLFNRFHDFKDALERGVRIRMITEKCENDKSLQRIMRTLMEMHLFSIRYVSAPIPVKTVIHDGTEVNMCIATSPDSDVPSLWSNNPQFVKVMKTHFEALWDSAIDVSENLTRKTETSKQTKKFLIPV